MTLTAPLLFGLSGPCALVTGAGSGIGQALALGLAQAGARVACLNRPRACQTKVATGFVARHA